MLSEFDIAKPNPEFNQIFLNNQEVFLESIKVKLCLTKHISIPGQLHLNTRSLFFQPKEEKSQLIKFKFCDSIVLKILKTTIEHLRKDVGEKFDFYEKNLSKYFYYDKDDLKKSQQLQKQKQKNIVLLIRCKKFVLYERSPPSPCTVQILNSYFCFQIDEISTSSECLYTYGQTDLDLFQATKNFEKLCQKVRNADDEDLLINELFQEKYQKYKKKIKKKKNIEFIYPCKIIQTFEHFYGAIYLTSKKKAKIVGLMNKTKNISFKFTMRDLKWLTIYEYFYKNSAVEFFFYSRNLSYLLNFETEKRAEKVFKRFKSIAYELVDVEIANLTKTWTKNLMTNYDYLMYLNRLSNRSFNDITRYPIFPWILSDYSNEELKINNKIQYRDFNKPIGTINQASYEKALKLYEYFETDPLPIKKPFHFFTYISNPGYIIFFYTRQIPSLILKLQSGAFGPNDRIFKSFESLWNQMHTGLTQFTELIPEFYSLNKSHILMNKYKLDFGNNQHGEQIDDVGMARWSNGMEDFMFKMKSALESEHCSLNLHKWINLIFGYQQKGQEAIKKGNVFNETCYKENYENNHTKSQLKLSALKLQIQEYGQMPLQLFTFEHPKKKIKAQIVMNSSDVKQNFSKNKNSTQQIINDDINYSNNSKDILNKLKKLKENFEITDTLGIQNLTTENNQNEMIGNPDEFFIDNDDEYIYDDQEDLDF